MDYLEVDVDVIENCVHGVRSGRPVFPCLNAYPNWQIPADVIAVIPLADHHQWCNA
jgi:hypothetical protein